MKVFNYIIEPSLGSRHNFAHFKVHKRGEVRHLVWGKVSVLFGPVQYCEECETENGLSTLCDKCQEHYFCECGSRLCEEEGSSPGDGFCRRCG